jgi:uncharacterized protein (TIGR00297 family)
VTVAVAGALAWALAVVGRTMKWLTTGGAIAAALVGTAIFAGAGLGGASLLTLFFVSGSLLTRVSHSLRPIPGNSTATAGRDANQVIANGLWAAVGAVLIEISYPLGGWPLMTGALAAAQGDTWATEIGAFSTRPPRLLSTGRKVSPGTSGGVTLLGTLGGLAGVSAMAGLSMLVGVAPATAFAAFAGGIAGVTADSMLGATIQGSYRCDSCDMCCERPRHTCGRPSRQVRGWSVINNDGVNFVATGVGGFVSLACWLLL